MCGGRLVGSGENTVKSFYTDSRETTPGKMFVPIRGENTDAHRFIPQVFAAGAAATFSEELLDAPAGDVVYVENTRAALQKVAERYRERFNIPVSTIWALTRQGKFPQPLRPTKRLTLWKVKEVENWLSASANEEGQL